LSEQKKQQLEGQCDKLRQSQTSSEKGEAAGNLKGGLERLSRALATDNARRRAQINSDRLAEMQRQMEAAQSTMQSAREFVRQTLLAERNLEKRADPRRQTTLPALAEEQRQLKRSLEDFVRKNPQSFSRSQGQCSAAQSAMGKAAQSMADKSPDARQRAGQAADELQKLDDSLEQQQQHNRLADAYELKRMLDEQISQLGQCQRHGAGAGQRQQLARQSRSITGQLKQIAEQEPTSGQFGAELREALSDENKRQLDAQSDRLASATDPAEQKSASGELQKGLQEVSRAFDASCPGMAGGQRRGDPLMATGQEAITRGMRHLDSAARGRAAGRRLSPQDRSRLGREALANLEAGVPEIYGYNERSRQVLDKLDQDLKEPGSPIDMQTVRDLVKAIQGLRREVAADDEPPEDEVQIMHIDPARLPPDYRESIEKYYQKLSEQR
jgi:hypothetical protein